MEKKVVSSDELTVKFYPKGSTRYIYDHDKVQVKYAAVNKAISKYAHKNKDFVQYCTQRAIAKRFIREYGKLEDVKALLPLLEERLNQDDAQ